MSLESLAAVVAAHAKCAGLSVDIRILKSPGMALRPEFDRAGRKVPLDTEDYRKLPVEGVMIGTTHIIVKPDSRGYALIRIGSKGEGIMLPPSAVGKAGWALESVVRDGFLRVVRLRLKSFHDCVYRGDDPEFACQILPETHVVPALRRDESLEALPLSGPEVRFPFAQRKKPQVPRPPPVTTTTTAPPPPTTTPGTTAPDQSKSHLDFDRGMPATPSATPPMTSPPPPPAPPPTTKASPPPARPTWRPKKPAPAAAPEAPVAAAFAAAPAGPAAPATAPEAGPAPTPAPAREIKKGTARLRGQLDRLRDR